MTNTKNKHKVSLGIAIVLAVLAIGGALGLYYMAPSSYLALDVNPSIEIHTNRLNQVTSIDPVNEDAKNIMTGYQLTDRNLETVIKNIVDRMILNGFIASDKDNQILITTGEDQNASELSKTVNTIVETYLTEKQVDANLIPQSIKITAQGIEEAHKNHVSAGKMAIIQKLIESDNTLSVDQLSKKRISDLVTLAVSNNISLDGIVYIHAIQNASSNSAILSGTTNKVYDQTANSSITADKQDSSKVDQNEDQSNNKLKRSRHEDTKDEDQKGSDNEDNNYYQKDNENEDQSDIENQDDSDEQEASDVEDQDENQKISIKKSQYDYQKNEDNEDQYDSENDSDNEDYEYKQSDSENDNQEDIQKGSVQENHSDSQNSDYESEGYDD